MRTLASIGAGLVVLVLAVTLPRSLGGGSGGRSRRSPAPRAVRKGRLDEVRPLPRSRIYELDEANRSFGEMIEGLRERNLIRETLGQFLPEQVAHELLAGGGSSSRSRPRPRC